MFSKVLVANRGEIAVRAFRAAYELGAQTVAVFPHEDRGSEHRLKADEAYEIGERGHPVRAYLDPDLVVQAALSSGADAIYPGYGFLSENPRLAEACANAGITFIGPTAEVLTLTGNKARAIGAAKSAGVPTLASVEPSTDVDELVESAKDMPFPLFVKAVAGGGGRGMRRVESAEDLRDAIETCMREAEGAFGDPTVFIEQAVVDPRHIEVQILADGAGNVIHLFERDCSVQRRHQKVVEIAPAPNLDPSLRERICADAVRFATEIGYRNAGTVEFLLDTAGDYDFIEMNPRIQVEHTVTEEVTDVDLVQAQMRIASGETLEDLGLSQDGIVLRGAALQCRITTEDPANGFRPDTGKITTYRSPGGAGVRLDGGTTYSGAEVSAHFDSMLAKLDLPGPRLPDRGRPGTAGRRGVPHPRRLHEHPVPAGGARRPRLPRRPADHGVHRGPPAAADRAVVGRPRHQAAELPRRHHREPAVRRGARLGRPGQQAAAASTSRCRHRTGSRQALLAAGPEGFARALREQQPVAVTDTTFRDAHQSLLATRVRTRDLTAVAGHVARMTPQLWSLEAWGGATYDVALRFLSEDPWERLAKLRHAVPNICLQMLLRGRNTVGYTPYPTEVTEAFVHEAARTGIDVFRIFDALNDVEQMRPAIEAVRATGTTVAEVALCYTGDLSSPDEKLYTLDYYLALAERIVKAGAHVLAIKDMAGLLRAPAARVLVRALRERFDLPVHLHTHDTPGGQLATLLAAIDAGVDAVDAATASMAGTTSQPALLGAGGDDRPDRTSQRARPRRGVRPRAVLGGRPTRLRAVRVRPRSAHRTRLHPRDPRRPALEPAAAGGLARARREVRADRGHVRRRQRHPRQHRQGDAVVEGRRRPRAAPGRGRARTRASSRSEPGKFDVPDSVIGFLSGDLGEPPGGWPEPFRTKALEGRTAKPVVADLDEDQREGLSTDRRLTLNALLFPGPTADFAESREKYGDLSVLPTTDYLYGLREGEEHVVDLEEGKRLLLGLEAVSEPDERGIRTVMCTINGQLRPVNVRDRSVAADAPTTERADPSKPGQVAAPFDGVVTFVVSEGDTVEPGATVATIEAMKMEAAITAPVGGTVERLAIGTTQQVVGGDLVLVLSS